MLTDIIIPTYGKEELTIDCIRSIKKHTVDFRIIWVDNGSSLESREIVEKELEGIPHISSHFDERIGFVKAVNHALSMSTSENVVIQNNDTRVTAQWLERLSRAPFDIVGPITSPCESWQSVTNLSKHWGVPSYTGDEDEYSQILKNRYDGKYREVSGMVAFFSTLIRRKVIDMIGVLSEEFGVGFGDDDEYCARAKKAGFSIGVALDAFVLHLHNQTFKSVYSDEEIASMKAKNMAIYKNHTGLKPTKTFSASVENGSRRLSLTMFDGAEKVGFERINSEYLKNIKQIKDSECIEVYLDKFVEKLSYNELKTILFELRRVLSKNGFICFEIADFDGMIDRYRQTLTLNDIHGVINSATIYTEPILSQLLQDMGFTQMSTNRNGQKMRISARKT